MTLVSNRHPADGDWADEREDLAHRVALSVSLRHFSTFHEA
jgi:hypothetical protein